MSEQATDFGSDMRLAGIHRYLCLRLGLRKYVLPSLWSIFTYLSYCLEGRRYVGILVH